MNENLKVERSTLATVFGSRLLKKFGMQSVKVEGRKLSNGRSFGETLSMLKVESHK